MQTYVIVCLHLPVSVVLILSSVPQVGGGDSVLPTGGRLLRGIPQCLNEMVGDSSCCCRFCRPYAKAVARMPCWV